MPEKKLHLPEEMTWQKQWKMLSVTANWYLPQLHTTGDIFPFNPRTYIENLTERSYQNRTIGLIENGSWAPAAARIMQGMFEKSKNITWLENNVKMTSSSSEANQAEIEAMAEELCK